ncbi:MAG TPA: hypothetical protein PKW80_11155 [Bacteroidales bacterium]|nr:hypothetical protein [Bacteroidales bacterium]
MDEFKPDRQKIILQLISSSKNEDYIKDATIPVITRYSVYKKLLTSGFLFQDERGYNVEDPFFAWWVWMRRLQ